MASAQNLGAEESSDQNGQLATADADERTSATSDRSMESESFIGSARHSSSLECENCRQNGQACDGRPICGACTQSQMTCVYNERREENSNIDVVSELNMYRSVLHGLRYAIRNEQQGTLMAMIRQGASVEEVAATIQHGPEFDPVQVDTPRSGSEGSDAGQQYEHEQAADAAAGAPEAVVPSALSNPSAGIQIDGRVMNTSTNASLAESLPETQFPHGITDDPPEPQQ